ncbi:hypothetical protein LOTGIDRAFT_167151 [Lottia gigantea]|uniref:Sushi domain-containing protein n=1 Tax=Lottia gigantea TaxID=225164 RepID=V3ZPU1_LOTGI|nr:hypothetical protein LOTGIDRAFT_167151 [Lottia gigantea]ESO86337.1 hypothetical protein LOTGIDRAFT_167151 [Lottia gigantea]
MVDSCSFHEERSGWSIGISTPVSDSERNAKIYFSLRCGRSRKSTFIYAHSSFTPNKWVNIAVSYNGSEMVLFINKAKISVSHEQIGDIFPLVKHSCRIFYLGGAEGDRKAFRGTIDELSLWSTALPHGALARTLVSSNLVLKDNFDDVKRWTMATGRSVEIVYSDIQENSEVELEVPPCGQTICDNPEVVLSYSNNWLLRTPKTIRYRIVNLMNDDGSRPTVLHPQIQKQHEVLNNAYRPYNISFELNVANIRNTSLNSRFMMFGCDPSDIGNGQCNEECKHARTGNDGGDCYPIDIACDPVKLGNGQCDYECNRRNYDWDAGDCCIPGNNTHFTCYNPSSSHRGYMSVVELKEILRFDSRSHLNVYLVAWTTGDMIGVATFPWEKHVYSVQGGTVVQPETFGVEGQMDSLVHEIGHNFGLWHVHHGVSEVPCGDQCLENEPSMIHGDMCADTFPTPKNQGCHDPLPTEDACGSLTAYKDTPFRNYMSYSADNCSSEFTPHQTARMHCYLDLVYQPWRTSTEPAPIPLAPRIAPSQEDSVTIIWTPPLSSGINDWESVCNLCSTDGSLTQYAVNASSPSPTDRWSPQQATGSPDAEKCDSSTRAWMPNVYSCKKKGCRIDLYFKWPVIPERLSIWVVWNAVNGIKRIKLYFEGGQSNLIKDLPAHCDMPLTSRLNVDKNLTKIRIYTKDQYVAIDAVEVTSSPQNSRCDNCHQLKYHIYRDPPFKQHHFKTTQTTQFTDSEVEIGKSYRYWIKASGSKISQSSPSLHYKHGQPYCGDGVVNQSNEECDDRNINSYDGCSSDCQIEPSFQCKGEPSLCYRHDGDGVCEEFEKTTSIRDCGFYIPPGYMDQLASSAIANPQYQHPHCPVTAVLGQPSIDLVCNRHFDSTESWHPCGSFTEYGDFWIEVYFPRLVVATEVIIHLASDGSVLQDSLLSVELIKQNNETSILSPRIHTISCDINPFHIPVIHDLSQPFYYTKGVRLTFTSFNISISAVRLRSYKYLDPITIASCTKDELFNPRSGHCVSHDSQLTTCPPYLLDHSTVLCTGHSDGDECSITCIEGYRLTSTNNKIVCSDGQWSSSSPVRCELVECGVPVIPHSTTHCNSGTTLYSNCTFNCIPPAKHQGQSNTVQCDVNGLWTLPLGACIKQCSQPKEIPFAKIASRKCRRGPQPIGAKCKYRCRKGFKVESSRKKKRRVTWRTCGENGEWSNIACERVRCPPIDPVHDGQYACTDGINTGSTCTMTPCTYSRQLIKIKCMKNGKWSGQFKSCEPYQLLSCSRPVAVDLNFRCTQLVVGSSCRVRCKRSTHEPILETKHHIPVTNHEPREITRYVVCSDSKEWYPSPEYLDRRGDGWCDEVNNREHCGWDNGDCCESTAKSGLLPFSRSCIVGCTCQDPNAIENISKSKLARARISHSNG